MEWLQATITSLTGAEVASTSNQQPATDKGLNRELQNSGELTKPQLLQYFSTGEELLRSGETRRKLKDAKLLKQVLHLSVSFCVCMRFSRNK